MGLETLELWLGRAAGAAGLVTLGVALWRMRRALRQPAGRGTGRARQVLRWPRLALATVVFVVVGVALWRPLPVNLAYRLRLGATVAGLLLYSLGLALYVWGLRVLGRMFAPASGLGVRLLAGQRLITHGPYGWVRHPMYLAVIITFLGGTLLYRTWTMALYAMCMLGTVRRAQREEAALAQEFGGEWEAYARRVPGWLPRLKGE